MAIIQNQRIVFVSRPAPGKLDTSKIFKLDIQPIDPEKDVPEGSILIKSLYLSLDPAMRGWMNDARSYIKPVAIGEVMRGSVVGRVIVSKNHPKFKTGDLVQGLIGWQQYAISNGKGLSSLRLGHPKLRVVDAISTLGGTGMTAYFGLLDVGRPKPGETVVISGAAGATGSVVGQIAKIAVGNQGKVIGIAGSDEKCEWLVRELGFDHAVNYKSPDWKKKLREYTPKYVDVFFDNVGGEILDETLKRMATKGRIVVCGAISQYNANTGAAVGPVNYINIIPQRLRMEGFIVFDYQDRYPEAITKLSQWIVENKIKSQETIVKGLENAPNALVRLFEGANTGKMLIEVGDDVDIKPKL